jgi:nickel-dependent lactate racemase
MLFMVEVGHGFKDVSVAGEATDILWGAGPDCSDKARVFGPRNGIIVLISTPSLLGGNQHYQESGAASCRLR